MKAKTRAKTSTDTSDGTQLFCVDRQIAFAKNKTRPDAVVFCIGACFCKMIMFIRRSGCKDRFQTDDAMGKRPGRSQCLRAEKDLLRAVSFAA